ncbi:MAG TPA: SIS domain-containing protein [Solirubrobacteraceae bacterium]|nr:SIS domain-containing protein [Solirubrobacteraceae bacterium]
MNHVERLFRDRPEAADFADGYLGYLSQVFARIDREAVALFVQALERARAEGATVFFCGNGGSAATASHFQNDLTRWRTDPMKVVSLTDNVAVITALANDYGYERIFVMQLEPLLAEGDVVIAISASGNSPNVVQAIEFANERKAVTVGLTGFDGGRLGELCEIHVHVPSARGEYGPVEDAHMVLDHLVMSYLWEKWAHAVTSEA